MKSINNKKLVEIPKSEFKMVLKAISLGKGDFDNQSIFCGSAGCDYHLHDNVYRIDEMFETITDIYKYEN